MDKIASKQIDGVVDLSSFQQVSGRKQFNSGIITSNGAYSHYPVLGGGFLHFYASPDDAPQDGDYRIGISPATSKLEMERYEAGTWHLYCPQGCANNCLAYGTLILLPDGTQKPIEELQVGDMVATVSIKGMDTEKAGSWRTFRSSLFAPEPAATEITGIIKTRADHHYVINETLRITHDHPILVQHEGIYQFMTARELFTGEKMFHFLHGWVRIVTIERVDEPIRVANINVASRDTYFADNFLVHNLNNPSRTRSR